LIVFPYGDWYGNLESSDVPGLIDFYTQALKETPPAMPFLYGPNRYQWRGRMALTKQEQLEVFNWAKNE
jgi:ketosteroid isomerase-like protein